MIVTKEGLYLKPEQFCTFLQLRMSELVWLDCLRDIPISEVPISKNSVHKLLNYCRDKYFIIYA